MTLFNLDPTTTYDALSLHFDAEHRAGDPIQISYRKGVSGAFTLLTEEESTDWTTGINEASDAEILKSSATFSFETNGAGSKKDYDFDACVCFCSNVYLLYSLPHFSFFLLPLAGQLQFAAKFGGKVKLNYIQLVPR